MRDVVIDLVDRELESVLSGQLEVLAHGPFFVHGSKDGPGKGPTEETGVGAEERHVVLGDALDDVRGDAEQVATTDFDSLFGCLKRLWKELPAGSLSSVVVSSVCPDVLGRLRQACEQGGIGPVLAARLAPLLDFSLPPDSAVAPFPR